MIYILIFYLLVQNENSNFSKAEPENQLEECHELIISEYILLKTNIQTDIFAEYRSITWDVYRGFHENDVKNLEIKWKEQTNCLAKFLVKTYGIRNVIGMKTPDRGINEETSIHIDASIKHINEFYVFRWDWDKTKIPEESFKNLHYNEGTPELQKLALCKDELM
uniref:Uncharacterized protein n=1 Tax=Meloidogyne hapla TaxID=6305 RepID=A0A1I8C0E1_MELHA